MAQLTDPAVVRKILAHLGLPTEPPRPAPSLVSGRSREQFDFACAARPLRRRAGSSPANRAGQSARSYRKRARHRPSGPHQPRNPTHRAPSRALVNHLTNRRTAANLRLAVDDDRLRRKSSAWMSYPLGRRVVKLREVPGHSRGSATKSCPPGHRIHLRCSPRWSWSGWNQPVSTRRRRPSGTAGAKSPFSRDSCRMPCCKSAFA